MMTGAEIRAKNIREGRELRPFYLLVGEETFLRDTVINALVERLVPEGPCGLNYHRIEGDLDAVEDAISTSLIPPFGADVRLVVAIYDGSIDLGTSKSDRGKRVLSQLEGQMRNPVDWCCFVLSARDCDRKLDVWRLAQDSRAVVECKRPSAAGMVSWIRTRAESLGIELERKAAESLSKVHEGDMYRIWNELNLLAAYVNWKGKIDEKTLRELGLFALEERVFGVIDAIGERKGHIALSLLEPILAHKDKSMRLFYMLARHFRCLWRTKILLQMGCSPREIQSKLKVHPFVAKKLCEGSSRFSESELTDAVLTLYQMDLAIKSGRIDVETALETFTLTICRRIR